MASRILVKGASGTGKSTLARALAQRLKLPYVELDALYHGPNWTAASTEELQGRVRQALDDARGWVVDGNYDSNLGTALLDRAELIVWLDLPLPIKLWRLLKRSARRWLRRELLWNGNRESLKDLFWGRGALFPWAWDSHFHHRREWPEKFHGRAFIRLRTAREVEAWLRDLRARASTTRGAEAA